MGALPGNISSMIRRLPDLDGRPFVVERAQGPRLTDTDGRTYVDLAMAMGSTILGHAHPAMVEACTQALKRGSMPGFSNEYEGAAADALVRHAGPLRYATFVTTGSEAVHLACRIARRTTGRSLIAKIAAGFNGWYDDMAFAWSGSPEADMAGTRPTNGATTLVRWADLDDLRALFRESDDIAAVIIEPMLANAGSLRAPEGYLAEVTRIARSNGAMIIADEVLMGLRLHPGPTCLKLGFEPDLVTMGKAIGSGVPVAAVLGTETGFAAVLDGRAARAGTYHGNPLVASAVLATMQTLDSEDYPALLARGERFRRTVEQVFAAEGHTVSTSGFGSVFSLWPSPRPPATYAESRAMARPDLSAQLHLALRRHGVVSIPGAWGRVFLSFVHDDAALSDAAEGFARAAADIGAKVA